MFTQSIVLVQVLYIHRVQVLVLCIHTECRASAMVSHKQRIKRSPTVTQRDGNVSYLVGSSLRGQAIIVEETKQQPQ